MTAILIAAAFAACIACLAPDWAEDLLSVPPPVGLAGSIDWAVAHECGHALVVSVSPWFVQFEFCQADANGGFTMFGYAHDASPQAAFDRLATHLAGMAGEHAAYGRFIGHGSDSDIEKALEEISTIRAAVIDERALAAFVKPTDILPTEVRAQVLYVTLGRQLPEITWQLLGAAYQQARRTLDRRPASFRSLRIALKRWRFLSGLELRDALDRGLRQDRKNEKTAP